MGVWYEEAKLKIIVVSLFTVSTLQQIGSFFPFISY